MDKTKSNEIAIFENLKNKLPFIFHNVSKKEHNSKDNKEMITPTIRSTYLMTGKRIAVPFYKSISRMCLSVHKENNEL